ncbi:MAG TPA: hypothetical protein VLV15_08655 [Dongiaceae bacterium]|nr:hypothetical protein [Dongiaceae bacterium]
MKQFVPRSWVLGILGILTLGVVAAFLPGCSKDLKSPLAPVDQLGSTPGTPTVELSLRNPVVVAAVAVQDRHTRDLMSVPSVIGTATGLDASGHLAVLVLTERALGAGRLPATLEGLPVVEEVTGKIVAMADHKVKQTAPIQLGTSGGWRYDLANGYCCGGTLGSLVKKGSTQYVLSNYHVFEADIVSGGNSRIAQPGDPVVQPGLIDVACNAATAQNVASLSGIKSLPGSNVDCAIAQVISGMVRTDGAILDVGTISASTVGASVNQLVKKSGRTTGLTRSRITGLNATVSVAYENECAGGSAFTKTFTGQILVRNQGSRFLNSGDSGSLMVEDVSTNPRAVGLLFAGSSTTAVANPIGQVLSFLGATMVGH